ncbi:MAG: YezD family protein [Sphingobium sp.]|nr:YezD family protein [Sphingobium sp.]
MHIDEVRRSTALESDADAAKLNLIRDALQRLRFGSIQLTVHEGKLVQIDVTEKTRLPA